MQSNNGMGWNVKKKADLLSTQAVTRTAVLLLGEWECHLTE